VKAVCALAALRFAGVLWMLVAAAGIRLAICAFLTPGGEHDRWLDTSIVAVPSCALLCGGYGLVRIRRWAKPAMLVEMPLLLLWCLGWLFDAEDALSIALLISGCSGALVTIFLCLVWHPAMLAKSPPQQCPSANL
jgi:hypothetical protein